MKTIILAIAAVASLTATAVSAQGIPTATVSYADLDLHSLAGMKTLHVRIRNAANSVCSVPTSGDLASRTAAQKCRSVAITGAMKQVPDFATQQVASR